MPRAGRGAACATRSERIDAQRAQLLLEASDLALEELGLGRGGAQAHVLGAESVGVAQPALELLVLGREVARAGDLVGELALDVAKLALELRELGRGRDGVGACAVDLLRAVLGGAPELLVRAQSRSFELARAVTRAVRAVRLDAVARASPRSRSPRAVALALGVLASASRAWRALSRACVRPRRESRSQ